MLLDLAQESQDNDLAIEFYSKLKTAEKELNEFELSRMLSGKHDSQDAILEINSGAGGTDAQDWGEILLRMYLRWAEQHNFQAQLLDSNPGEEAGIKSATVLVQGLNAYGFLRSEKGVHRLVRLSPFDSNHKRHTSFASVSLVPDIEEEIQIEIRPEDLRIDTFRAGGAGGQHINKTDSAVRITHLATGIVVGCQSDRSQHRNKEVAMKLLKAKLYDVEEKKQKEALNKISGEKQKIDFGSQIRNYVMHPYQMVKDVRTEFQVGNVQAVLDGDLDPFIQSYLLSEYSRED